MKAILSRSRKSVVEQPAVVRARLEAFAKASKQESLRRAAVADPGTTGSVLLGRRVVTLK